MNSTTVVIVNYRTADLVVNCLRSLEQDAASMPGLHAVVVDNASGDDSAQTLRRAIDTAGWSRWVTLIESARNGGFSAGNNIGIRSRCSKLYLLLNPDTLVKPGAIHALIAFMQDHPRAGIVGSQLENQDGRTQSTARRCLSPLTELEAGANTVVISRLLSRVPQQTFTDEPIQCDWVSGAAMCVRREVFEEVGLLDEGFFLYFEELDLCERARRASRHGGRGGWEVWSIPQSRIVHMEGASTGITDVNRRRPTYWYESRRRFFLKRHGVLGLVCADILWGCGRLSFAARKMFRHNLNGRASNPTAKDLLLGDARALLSGSAFRIARGG